MKQRSVQAMHDGHALRLLPSCISFSLRELFLQVQILIADAAVGITSDLINVPGSSCGRGLGALLRIGGGEPSEDLAILVALGCGCGGGGAADFSDAEDGFPSAEFLGGEGGVAEPGGGEGSFGPAVIDACDVPLDCVRGGVAVELVADVDEVLDRGDVDVVDGGEVEDNCFEGGEVAAVGFFVTAAGARVVPGAVAETWVAVWVCAARLSEDGGDHVVEVMVGVGIVVAFAEAVDEDAWIWRDDVDVRVGAVVVIDRKEDVAHASIRIQIIGAWFLDGAVILAIVGGSAGVREVVPNDRVNLNLAKESTFGFHHAEQENSDA